jgi:glycogen debranching enzyme
MLSVIHIERKRFLYDERLFEHLQLHNFSEEDASLPVCLRVAADFADIFEVQGHVRVARGDIRESLRTEICSVSSRAPSAHHRRRDATFRTRRNHAPG